MPRIRKNKASWGHNVHTLRSGRSVYLTDSTARPDTAEASTTRRQYVRKGRSSYVNDVFGKRKD